MQGGNPFGQPGFGQPGMGMNFDEDDSFVIGGGRRNRKQVDPNNPEIERQHGVFHEKLGSILGPSYIIGKSLQQHNYISKSKFHLNFY